jgi:leader peptidase (prepilin peptidase)/N-methyltransferase
LATGRLRGGDVTLQEWIIEAFIFAFGCCIGSFLNVVIYRLPRGKSLVSPGSACPTCGKPIRFYDNVPLVSWLLLGRKCRYCRTPISPRYFVVELLTGLIFLGLHLAYFHWNVRSGMQVSGGWLVYVIHVALLSAFIAGSGIDLAFWVIPLSICWLVTGVGLVGSAVAEYVIDPKAIREFGLLPVASPTSGALALGAAVGLVIALLLLKTGLLKRSYETSTEGDSGGIADQAGAGANTAEPVPDDPQFKHRIESLREILFLAPVILCALLAYAVFKHSDVVARGWTGLVERPAVGGFLGSLFGYFVGSAVVWVTRILGTLAFGKEAMGLGDAHLMGAAGAVIGPVMVVVAFFVAPFFGLAWAVVQMLSRKIRQIPYGPFLSLGVLVVMICHDWILARFVYLLPK